MPNLGKLRAIVLFVILALSFAACGYKSSSRRTVAPAAAVPLAEAPRRTLPPLPERPLSPRLRSLRAEAMQAASRTRGLAWLGETGMTELSGWEYGTRTREIADVLGTDDLKGMTKLAVAGGMLPEGVDLASLAVSFTAVAAGATYSPLDKQVLLLAEDAKSGARADSSLLVHEFTHALQDQHFDLLRMLLVRPYDFDRTEAVFALVEGDALNVERRLQYGESWSRMTLEEVTRAEDGRFDPYRETVGKLFPPLLTETFIFRYRDGVRFVEAMRRQRPAVSADDLFRRPPATSEQVLHPEKYLLNEAPRDASVRLESFAERGWHPQASTALGEVGVRGLLLAGVTLLEARRAAAGWGGDRAYVFEREGGGKVFVWKMVWDKPSDAREFFRAYEVLKRRSAPAGSVAPVEGGGELRAWDDGAARTLVHVEGDVVLLVRGAASDVNEALRLVLEK